MAESTNRPLAVVTGASTGSGYHLARIFAEKGYDLLVTRMRPALKRLPAISRRQAPK